MNHESNSFAERLQSQLRLRGKSASPTLLAREFNLRWRGAPVSTNAARKWLQGDALPKMEKIQVLAKMLGTSAEWLRWGQYSGQRLEAMTAVFNPAVDSSVLSKQLAESVMHDWSLLTQENKELISSILDFLLKQQNASDK